MEGFKKLDFPIASSQEVSREFLKLRISDFENACRFISELPYKRNFAKENLLCIFEDNGGTCSTKHAVLRKLALENQKDEVKLMLGIFKMDSEYAPEIAKTLSENGLDYIPEAHNYLKIGTDYFDFTKPNSKYTNFSDKIIMEKEIKYNQISKKKVELHKKFLAKWIMDKPDYNLDYIWEIRERCIEDLQN